MQPLQKIELPAVATPAHRGFGSRMISRALSGEPAGEMQLHFHQQGIVCEMAVALPPLDAQRQERKP